MKNQKVAILTGAGTVIGAIAGAALGKLDGPSFWAIAGIGVAVASIVGACILRRSSKRCGQLPLWKAPERKVLFWALVFLALLGGSAATLAVVTVFKSRAQLDMQVVDPQGVPLHGIEVNVFAVGSRHSVGYGRVTFGDGTATISELPFGKYGYVAFRILSTNELELMDGRIDIENNRNIKKIVFKPRVVQVLRRAEVRFETGESNIEKAFLPDLNQMVNMVIGIDSIVLLHGHCDETGGEQRNDYLGSLRAKEVCKALKGYNLPRSRTIMISYGRRKPVKRGGPLSNEENRRTQCLVLPGDCIQLPR